jgi:hypothetical protein
MAMPEITFPRDWLRSIGTFLLGISAALAWAAVVLLASLANDVRDETNHVRDELECRGGINARVNEAGDRIQLYVGRGLVALARDDEVEFDRLTEEVEQLVDDFEHEQRERAAFIDDC